jgi:hypothetical protein
MRQNLRPFRQGVFYTEPPSEAHFAETGDEAVVVQITGFGPSSTDYVDPTQDPRRRKSEYLLEGQEAQFLNDVSALSEARLTRRVERNRGLERAFDKAVSNGPPLWGGYMSLKLLKSSAWKVQVRLAHGAVRICGTTGLGS